VQRAGRRAMSAQQRAAGAHLLPVGLQAGVGEARAGRALGAARRRGRVGAPLPVVVGRDGRIVDRKLGILVPDDLARWAKNARA
jgi:hypothetical protein